MRVYNSLVILLVVIAGCSTPVSTVEDQAVPPRTRISPHMEAPLADGFNVVYCSTFQLAWNDLKDNIVGGAVLVDDPAGVAAALNRSLSTRDDIRESDYVAAAGTGGEATLLRIESELERRGVYTPALGKPCRSCIVAYGYLDAEIRFAHRFESFDNSRVLHTGSGPAQVRAFGVYGYSDDRHRDLAGQVEILDYASPRSFVVRLRPARPDVEVVLAKVAPGLSLLETYERVEGRIAGARPTALSGNDVLVIPALRASFTGSCEPLEGRYLQNAGWEEYYFDRAVQDVRFAMDAAGVKVESDMRLALRQKGPPPQHKVMVFDTPYLMYVRLKDGKYPFFMLWVDNDELMIPGG